MKTGLILGKFMPFHNGHIALIDFALAQADLVTVLVCSTRNEPISGEIRYNWVKNYYQHNHRIRVVWMEYNEDVLSSSSVSSEEVSQKWASHLKEKFPGINLFISSEPYGEYVAKYWGINYLCFDEKRTAVPVSASAIRNYPFRNWSHIPQIVRPYFVKKICIVGSESTGKSVLTERLAGYYKTDYVPEMAREIVSETNNCTIDDLYRIAALHAETIIKKTLSANKFLFVDTDLTITKSYGVFLFGTTIAVEDWITEANRFDLYLFLETDCPYVQDGTRLNGDDREKLNAFHKAEFDAQHIHYHIISGDWKQRFAGAIKIIDREFF